MKTCKRNGKEWLAGMAALSLFCASCSWLTKPRVKDALRAADVACVLASALTDSQAVIAACQIEKGLAPVVEQLLAQKRAAELASTCRRDGGAQ